MYTNLDHKQIIDAVIWVCNVAWKEQRKQKRTTRKEKNLILITKKKNPTRINTQLDGLTAREMKIIRIPSKRATYLKTNTWVPYRRLPKLYLCKH